MKIIYNISSTATQGGGMERVIVDKINYLVEQFGHDILLITTDQKGRESFYPYSPKIRHIELEINYDDIARNNGLLRSYILYRKALKKHRQELEKILKIEKADVVVSLSRDEKEFLYKIKDGSKKILESHRCLKPRAWIEFERTKSWLMKLKILYRLIHESSLPRLYDRFVVLTEEDAKNWREKKNIIVIPNPLPFENVAKPNYASENVLCVGRISKDKGIDRLVDIWYRISADFPAWKLTLVGDIVDRDIITKIEHLHLTDSIQIKTVTPQILEEYLDASICVMTSRFEGLPMVLLEAYSVGLPVVAYAFKCGPRDVIDNSQDGFLVEEGDADDFVEKLGKLMKNSSLRSAMGEKARENSKRFAMDVVMNKWQELFLQLCNK